MFTSSMPARTTRSKGFAVGMSRVLVVQGGAAALLTRPPPQDLGTWELEFRCLMSAYVSPGDTQPF